MKLISHTKKNGKYILTVEEGWLFKRERQYVGRSTVWFTYPDFRRCGNHQEFLLHSLLEKIRFEEEQ